MTQHQVDDRITALAPLAEPLDPEWSRRTLTRVLAEQPPRRTRRRSRARPVAVGVAGLLALGSGAAVATGVVDPVEVVRDALHGFMEQPNTTGNDIGTLDEPELVAKFRLDDGTVFAVWVATSSSGAVCSASSDGAWDGVGAPPRETLEYGCGGQIVDPVDPDRTMPLERPDQIGGFFKDTQPLLYGVSPYPDTATVDVSGVGVDRTLPVRADSLGYGAALPEADRADSVTLTFRGADGRVLGSSRLVAPVG